MSFDRPSDDVVSSVTQRDSFSNNNTQRGSLTNISRNIESLKENLR